MNHLTVDLRAAEEVLSDVALIKGFLRTCCEVLGMAALGPPIVYVVEEDNPGVTAVQVITTSHVMVHTFVMQGQAYVDIFSCKDFDMEPALELVDRYFLPRHRVVGEVPRASINLFERPHMSIAGGG